MTKSQKITPFLWFDNQAEEAANFYVSVFGQSQIAELVRNGPTVLVADFSLHGQKFSALNGGPQFKFNPSVSFYVVCETAAETDAVWQKLADGGMALMPLAQYPWSEKYGWIQDRYGLSWQIALGKLEEVGGQKFTPSLLFTGEQRGRAEEALRLYTSLFKDSSLTGISHYKADGVGPEGTVEHAQFSLCGQTFMVMDNPMDQPFTFNEAVSFVVHCEHQDEIDFFWEKLIADGGSEGQCGWLKDKFGLSWQIVPTSLPKLLSDPDPAKAQTAMAALMQMRKIILADLSKMPEKTAITVQNTVQAPVEKAWKLWTGAEHIEKWNHASDDWHTPKAVNDLRVGGNFVFTMAAKDGSFSFDFEGTYDEVTENKHIAYTMSDGRKARVTFSEEGGHTHITEVFEAEQMNPHDMQQAGWQAILDNFKQYAEAYD